MSPPRWVSVLVVALALAPPPAHGEGPLPKLPGDVFAPPAEDDVVDVVILGNTRVEAIIRVHIAVGDRSFRASWRDFAVRFHAFLDRNGDGVLTVGEATRVSWATLLNNPLYGFRPVQPVMGPTELDTNPADGKVSLDELATYLGRAQRFEPLSAMAGSPPDPRAQAVLTQLDRNGDAILTPAELSESDALLGTLDRDEDEILSLDELTPNRSPLADRFLAVNPRGNPLDPWTSPVLPLTSAEDRMSAARRLLDTFGKKRPRAIGPGPLAAEPAEFEAADSDRDGLLDTDELRRYLGSPTTHLELTIELHPTRFRPGRVERGLARAGSSAAGLPTARSESNDGLVAKVAGAEIEFLAAETRNNLLPLFENRFRQADTDKDGALDAREARGDVLLQPLYLAVDRNGDGKMTESELRGYVDLANAAEEARILLTVSHQGIAMNERLDADRDGRFSMRELRAAPSKLAEFDSNRDGRIPLSELPRRTQIQVGRGPSPTRNRLLVVSPAMFANPRVGGERPNLPAWFAGMDRNRDGDVSPREFLGTPDQFRRFDADGDGLIDSQEASRIP